MTSIDIACPCPQRDGKRQHDTDTVTLRESLGFREASSIRAAVVVLKAEDPDASTGDVLAAMTEANVLAGIETWTLRDEKGKPIDVSRTAIREHILTHLEIAIQIGDAADEKYRMVMLPLVLSAFKSSPTSPTNGGTSRMNGSRQKRPRPLKPSSTITSPTVVIETTSSALAGVSSSSQNSESAA